MADESNVSRWLLDGQDAATPAQPAPTPAQPATSAQEPAAPRERRSGVLGRLRRREPETPVPGSPDPQGQAPAPVPPGAPAQPPPLQPSPAAQPRHQAAGGPPEDEIRGLTLVVEALADKVETLEKRLDAASGAEALPVEAVPPAAPAPAAPAPAAPTPGLPPGPAPESPGPFATGEGLDLNRAAFEDLRGLGLSVTQSKRVLAYRDERGGFRSVDELDQLPGFSRSQLEHLRRALTV